MKNLSANEVMENLTEEEKKNPALLAASFLKEGNDAATIYLLKNLYNLDI